jgi:UDP-N-acetylglucosamine 3-dehydrogenase
VDRERNLHVAVVGLGEFGQRYLQALAAMSGVTIAWVSDLDEQRCRQAAQRFGVPRFATEMSPLCADPALDAVIVVTPESAHREIAVAALDAGKHVIVEKPLATEEEDALAMIASAEGSGRRLLPAFLLRFDYRYAQLKQRLPLIEPVRTLYAYRNFDRSLFTLYSRTHSFVENAIHDIDLILWYVDSPVKRVHGFCRNTLGLPNPDINWGVLEFENGVLAVLQTTWLYPPQRHENLQWNAGIQVIGAQGVLEVANDSDGFRANTEETGIALLDQTGWADIHGEARGAFGAMLRHYVSCLRGEREYQGTTPNQALEAMRIARRLVADSEREERVP